MSDTTITITQEKRKMFREDANFVVSHEKKNLERVGAAEAILLLLDALEQADDYAEKLVYAVTDGNLSQTYDVQVVEDKVSSIWQAYTDEKVAKAKAEAEVNVARMTAERDWLATQLACIQSAYDIDQKTRDWSTARWAEAARRAVADESGVKA